MSIFTSFLIMFPITTYLGVIFLRITAWCYVYRDTSHIFGGSSSTFLITTGLIISVAIIIYFIIRPFEQVVHKIKNQNYIPTNEDKKKCLSSYKKFIIAIIVGNIIGFIIGQSASTIVEAILGINPINPYLFGVCLAQSIGVGANCALIIICAINELLGRYRILLGMESARGFEKYTNASIRTYLLLTVADAVYLSMTDIIAVPTGLLLEGTGNGMKNLSIYISDVFKASMLNIVFCIIPFVIVLAGLKKRIDSTKAVIEDIAEKGDLKKRIKLSLLDDFGLMLGSINDLMNNLSGMLKNIKVGTDSVNDSAQELSSISSVAGDAIHKVNSAFENISNEVSNQNSAIHKANENATSLVDGVQIVIRNVGEQTEALRQNSDSIIKMTENIGNVARLAQEADVLAKDLSKTSDEGKQSLMASVEMINEIESSAEEVQSVIKQIQRISSQTNLLAMNAAIEAAHAGAAGNGFAVVANEVRALASESAISAKNIQNQMKSMLAKVKDGVETINNAGEAFKNIASQVEKTTMLISTISSETENQKIGADSTMDKIKDLLRAIEQLKELTISQGDYAGELMTAMTSVLESSKKTESVIDDSNSATSDLKNVLGSVEHSVSGNLTAVESMKESVNIFTI